MSSRHLGFAFVVAMLASTATSIAAPLSQPQQNVRARVSFAVPVPLDEVVDMLKGTSILVNEFHHSFGSSTGGYLVQEEEALDHTVQSYRRAHEEFLEDRVSGLEQLMREDNDPLLRTALLTSLNQTQRDYAKIRGGEDLAIVSVDLVGDAAAIAALASSWESNRAVEIVHGPPLIIQPPDMLTVSCSDTDSQGKEFVPSWGKVQTREDSYSRHITQYMFWDSDSRLKWFKSNFDSTYEPDAFFYNYLVNEQRRGYGEAPFNYWASDLPRPYVDTQAFDSEDEKAVTIGSANATAIVSGRVYFTQTRMTNGRGCSGKTKLYSQRGRRVPSDCYSTFCSYPCSDKNNFITVRFDDFTSPGCREYWWWWSVSGNQACTN